MAEGKTTRLLKNVTYVFLGSIGVKIVQILMVPFYTKHFPPEQYGVIDLLTVYTTMLIALCVCNIYDSVFIFPHGKAKSVQTAYFSTGLLFGLGSLAFFALIAFALWEIGIVFQIENTFFRYIRVILLILVTTFLQNYVQQFARGSDKMIVYVSCGLIHAITLAGLSLVLIPKHGLNGYIFTMVTAPLVAALFGFFAGKMYGFFSIFSFRMDLLKAMLCFSVPLIPATFLWWLINSSNRPIIEHFYDLAVVGVFAIAAKLPGIMNTMYAIFQNAWQISVVEEFKKQDFEKYYNNVFYLLFSFLILVSCGVSICARFLVHFFTTKDFYDAWQYIPVLTLSIIFSNAAGFVGTNFTARKEGKYFFYSSIICMVLNIILNFILIPIFSLWGCTISICLSCMILFLSRVYYARVFVKFTKVGRLFGLLFVNLGFIALALCSKSFLINSAAFILTALSLLFLNRNLLKEYCQRFIVLRRNS